MHLLQCTCSNALAIASLGLLLNSSLGGVAHVATHARLNTHSAKSMFSPFPEENSNCSCLCRVVFPESTSRADRKASNDWRKPLRAPGGDAGGQGGDWCTCLKPVLLEHLLPSIIVRPPPTCWHHPGALDTGKCLPVLGSSGGTSTTKPAQCGSMRRKRPPQLRAQHDGDNGRTRLVRDPSACGRLSLHCPPVRAAPRDRTCRWQ